VEDHDTLLNVEVDVSIKKLNTFKISNLRANKDCGMIIDAKLKAKVKRLLNL
jgi:hypothetical protein